MGKNIALRAIGKLSRELQIPLLSATASAVRRLNYSEEELKAWQEKKLRGIVRHAYDTVPYYKRLFDENSISPSDIRTMDDLQKIPITTKADLQKEGCVSNLFDKKDLLLRSTSGSSGIPLQIYIDKDTVIKRLAESRRMLRHHGYRATDKHLIVSYFSFEPDFINRLGLFRQESIPWNVDTDEQLRMLKEYEADVIEGYPSRLDLLASEMEGIKIKSPRFIFTNSETLFPDVRKRIENAFGCPVVNVYDSEEFGQTAWECREHNGMHVNETKVVELVKDGHRVKPGQKGEIVITDLINKGMPLIRYAQGDTAKTLSRKCRCGIPLRLIGDIEGRKSDNLILPSGKEMSSTAIYFHDDLPGLVQYQAVQTSINSLDLNIVVNDRFKESSVKKMKNFLREMTTIQNIRVKKVKSIRTTKRAKFRRFIPLSSRARGRES